MRKQLLLTATILCLSLPVAAVRAEPPGRAEPRPQFSAADAAAFTNARIAALKVGLELTPAQEKLWAPLETTLRDMAKARATGRNEMRERAKEAREKHDVLAMMRLGGKSLEKRGAEMEKLADAAKPLYDSLDDGQKRRFGILLHMVRQPFGPDRMGPGPQPGPGAQPDDDDKD
jgi:hypothetical protein